MRTGGRLPVEQQFVQSDRFVAAGAGAAGADLGAEGVAVRDHRPGRPRKHTHPHRQRHQAHVNRPTNASRWIRAYLFTTCSTAASYLSGCPQAWLARQIGAWAPAQTQRDPQARVGPAIDPECFLPRSVSTPHRPAEGFHAAAAAADDRSWAGLVFCSPSRSRSSGRHCAITGESQRA